MKRSLLAIGVGLVLLAQAATVHAVDVTIKRDAHGTPHVYAKTVRDLFYGYGYAVAQDRLYQLEMIRRSTQGRVAEVLGEKFVEFDRAVRSSFAPERIQAQIEGLPRADKDVLEGYAAGMNAWLREVRAKPARWLPKQFKDMGFEPADWSAYDVAMIYVGTVALRFSDPNSEIDNLALLTALTDRHGAAAAQQMFDQLRWRVDPKAATTVPADEGQYEAAADAPRTYALPRYDGVPPVLERVARDAATGDLLDLPPAARRDLILAQLGDFGQTGIAGFPTASNFWLVGKAKARGANAILLNGPQFGWSAPAYTYGIGLHGAGFDVVGNTMYAMPFVMFGHNGRVSWGSTAGVGDGVDIFAEKLDPQDRTRYQHDGQWKRMDKRTETIQVKGAAPVSIDVYRTVHGLVTKFDEKNGVAYAKARAWEGAEVQSLIAWVHQVKARNWTEWKAQAARHALTVNWYYADRDGNIGYAHTGFYPKRRPGHDARLPVPGTGEMDWQGRVPFERNPQVYNPKQGYIANWNNSPMKGYPSADAFGVLWTQADRLSELESRLRERLERDGGIDADGMWSLVKPTSLADVNRRHFLPFLERAVAGLDAGDERAQLVAALSRWDGLNSDENADGFYDHAGPAILDGWLRAMLTRTLADELPADFFKWYSASGYPTPAAPLAGSVNLSAGAKVLFNVLSGADAGVPQHYDFLNGKPQAEVVLAALGDALAELKQRHGADAAAWRVPVAPLAFRASNFTGVPQGSAEEAISTAVTMNRGTENNMTVFAPAGVRAMDVVAPGQSGFIAPDGTPSPHARDQLELYVRYGHKPVWLKADDVARHTRTTTRLRR